MAKKVVATFSGVRGSSRTKVKCIRMDRSDRSGSYSFKEEMIPVDGVKDFFAKK
ncbi:MAG: DUF4295 domain-containing protein [Bacteroidia bacterium]|jgi:hypothetical protein|nr:DUF4295 domain-containing protein [Bacteroidales bacterium]MDD3300069.1 DUF4295 domain-containing protein [Bacteroidales bacterium]MDD3843596.1 DUF4295 domain-containing protein [Bacteroidales bacterium]MDD4617723.1 DUF4295 domain-containing protein [Bacteroidales bacterium]NCC46526.1 DUF4295 domain-containing protein [Bacteroidia bacterium]